MLFHCSSLSLISHLLTLCAPPIRFPSLYFPPTIFSPLFHSPPPFFLPPLFLFLSGNQCHFSRRYHQLGATQEWNGSPICLYCVTINSIFIILIFTSIVHCTSTSSCTVYVYRINWYKCDSSRKKCQCCESKKKFNPNSQISQFTLTLLGQVLYKSNVRSEFNNTIQTQTDFTPASPLSQAFLSANLAPTPPLSPWLSVTCLLIQPQLPRCPHGYLSTYLDPTPPLSQGLSVR